MSDIFDINEMSEEDIKHTYITTALESKWDAKKISMETELWKAVKNATLIYYSDVRKKGRDHGPGNGRNRQRPV